MNALIKSSLIFLFIIGITGFAQAQKFAYVDTDYILKNIPEYNMAQKQLDELSKQYQAEIEEKVAEVERLYKAFQTDAILLPADLKKQREEEILTKEKALSQLKRDRFGRDGDLFKKRQELVAPLQDKVFNAIKAYAEQKGLSIIFDKASGPTMLYANEKLDKSDDILQSMGYTPGESNANVSDED